MRINSILTGNRIQVGRLTSSRFGTSDGLELRAEQFGVLITIPAEPGGAATHFLVPWPAIQRCEVELDAPAAPAKEPAKGKAA